MTNTEIIDRYEEFVLYGSSPEATPLVFVAYREAFEAYMKAKEKWPDHRHRLVIRTRRVEEITLLLSESSGRTE